MLPRMRKRTANRPTVAPRRAAVIPTRTPPLVADPRGSTLATFLVCLLLLMMILPPNLDYGALLITGNNGPAEQNITSKVVLITVLIGSCVLIARRQLLWWAEVRSLNPFFLSFVVLALVSFSWSIDQPVSLRALFRLVVIFLCFTAFTLSNWRPERFRVLMRTLLGVLVVGSVVFAALVPHYGVQRFSDYGVISPGRIASYNESVGVIKPVLRGLTFGKNQMGQLASLALLFWFHAWLGKEVSTRWALLCSAAALIGLYWAHSSTSILAAGFSIPLLLMMRHWPRWLRRYMPYLLVMFAVLILTYSLVVLRLIPQLDFLLTPITALTGKDLTFSNRTAIWDVIIEHIRQHPLIGTGYMAYWDNENPFSPSQVFKKLMFFYPGESHNGYLEVLNDLGAVGGLCLLGFLFNYLRQAIRIMAFDRQQGSLYVALLFHQFWSSLSESHWFSVGSVPFTIVMLSVCTAARSLLQHRFELEAVPAARRAADSSAVPLYRSR